MGICNEFKNSNTRMDELIGTINSTNDENPNINEIGDLLLLYLIEEFKDLLNSGK